MSSCSCVRGAGAGLVIRRPLMLVMGDSMVLLRVCLVGQIQSWRGVVWISSVDMCLDSMWVKGDA